MYCKPAMSREVLFAMAGISAIFGHEAKENPPDGRKGIQP